MPDFDLLEWLIKFLDENVEKIAMDTELDKICKKILLLDCNYFDHSWFSQKVHIKADVAKRAFNYLAELKIGTKTTNGKKDWYRKVKNTNLR